jgi:WD40 repeat protein
MKPKCLFLFWMGLVWLTACGQSQQATVLPENSATETRSAEIPTLAFTNTATNFVTETATPTATRTPVPTATDFPRATPLAWQSEVLTDGVILYTSREQDNVIEKIDRENPLPEEFFSQEECCLMLYTGKMTSPDRKYAAIVTGADELLVTDGQTQISANLDKLNAIDIVYWPNNEQVFLEPKDYDSAPFGKLILYSPFTQEAKLIIPSFPDLVNTDLFPVPQWQNAMNDVKYDPSLSFVVYYRESEGEAKLIRSIVLWDTQSKRELWHRDMEYPASRPFASEPEWSPDGKHFAIFLPTVKNPHQLELVIIDSSGNETSIASSKLLQSIRYGAGLEWSPDGNFLAFYVQDNDQLRLLVYDLEKDEIWDPLIIIDHPDDMIGEMRGVVWSPDSTQFLTHLTLSLVDIEKKQVFEFPYRFRNAVWLTTKE